MIPLEIRIRKVSEMVEPGTNHIERVFNLKYPKEYTERPEKGHANQRAFAAFYEQLGMRNCGIPPAAE